MTELSTTYLGIKLKSPLVVAASPISSMIDQVRQAERAGAGAIVIRSLFEEQIRFDAMRLEEDLSVGANSFAEALSYFPTLTHGEADEHAMWIRKTRDAVHIPVIASLNAITPDGWRRYARILADTGVDALELNPYAVALNPDLSGAEIEQNLYRLVDNVLDEVDIPVSVKLTPFYTSTAHVVSQLAKHGVAGVVLFNRFLQPDIDAVEETMVNKITYSTQAERTLPMRWIALLYQQFNLDLAHNTGIHTGIDIARALLAGANVVQIASALLKHGVHYLATMQNELLQWMEEHDYEKLSDFRGKLSAANIPDPVTYERAQYVNLLMQQK